MNLALLFVLTTIGAVVLVFSGVNVLVSITISLMVYSIISLGPSFPWIFLGAFNSSMYSTLVTLTLSMIFANIYRRSSISEKLISSMEGINARFAAIGIPALIGMLPMPAGAYVSATMVDSVYRKIGFSEEEKTFLNYWFRHVWVSIWPLYQNIILASAILGLSIVDLISINWPVAMSSMISGLLVFSFITRGRSFKHEKTDMSGILGIWPFILLALITLYLRIPLYVALLITIGMFVIINRVPVRLLIDAVKSSLDFTVLLLIVVSLIYSNVLKETGVASTLTGLLPGYEALLVFTIPFFIVLATGFEFTFVALGFPPLIEILHSNPRYIALGFLGGFTGSMLSPAHACLVMSSRYFGVDIKKVYKYILPSSLLTIILTLATLSINA